MAAAATKSGNSGIFWMNGGRLTFSEIHQLPCLLSTRTYLIGSYKTFRKSLTVVTAVSMLESYF